MDKRKNIMECWKEFNPLSPKSMKDYFGDSPSPFQQRIIDYLNNGELALVSTSSSFDIFSGE